MSAINCLSNEAPKIMGTNMEYSLTRSFIEDTKSLLGGRGRDAAVMVVNSLGPNETLLNTERGKKFVIVLKDTLKIVGKKNDYNEVVFFKMHKC